MGKSYDNVQFPRRPNGWLNKDFRAVNTLLFKEHMTAMKLKGQTETLSFEEYMTFATQKKQGQKKQGWDNGMKWGWAASDKK